MPIPLQGIRVFIASPGGLDDERARFRELLKDFNDDDGYERGVAFLPIGWEATLPGMGRPQHIINGDVRRSDYLVLVLWDRWGTAPSREGTYTSGTEEEYEIARECLESTDKPMRDIVIMFKGVDARQLSDPGDQLRKVLAFKKRLEQEKSVLFATFDTLEEFERHLRRHLLKWAREWEAGKAPKKATTAAPEHGVSPEVVVGPGEDLLTLAEEHAKNGRLAEAEALYARAIVGGSDAVAVGKFARFLRRTGRLTSAQSMAEKWLAIAKASGNVHEHVNALGELAIVTRKQGAMHEAEHHLREAIALVEREGSQDHSSLAFLLDNLGLILRRLGRVDDALLCHERGLDLRPPDDIPGRASSYNNKGVLLRQLGRLEESLAAHEAALALSRTAGHYSGEALAHGNIGEVREAQGAYDVAENAYRESLALNEKWRSSDGLGMNYMQMGRIALRRNDAEEGERYAMKCLQVNELSGNREGIANALHLWGQVHLHRAEYREAVAALRRAFEIYKASGHRLGVAGTLCDLTTALLEQGDTDAATRELEEALRVARGLKHVQVQKALGEAQERLKHRMATKAVVTPLPRRVEPASD